MLKNMCLILISVFLLTACGSGSSDIAGTWESVEYIFAGEKQDRVLTIEFNADGTASGKMGPLSVQGEYVVDGDTITLTTQNGQKIEYILQDDGKLKTESPVAEIIYKKK